MKPVVLTSVCCYKPGYKSGGPIRSIANLADRLGDEIEFKIITTDRDFGDENSFPGLNVNRWNTVGNAQVFYMSPNKRSLRDLKNLCGSTDYDILYLNSVFSPGFTIKILILRRLGLIPDRPLVIASRGELSPNALRLKRLKKSVYLSAAKTSKLYRGVIWQASNEREGDCIRRCFGRKHQVMIAPNVLPKPDRPGDPTTARHKREGRLKIIFLSRISRKKNLDTALRLIAGLRGKIEFRIYGPLEDTRYWAKCRKIIDGLPENIDVHYCGSVVHEKVNDVLGEHDLFFLPTLGENFSHVIFEAFAAGCPVLISDQTPWRGLEEKGVGWDISLSRPELFRKILQRCVDMNNAVHKGWVERAREFGIHAADNEQVIEENRRLFLHAAGLVRRQGH